MAARTRAHRFIMLAVYQVFLVWFHWLPLKGFKQFCGLHVLTMDAKPAISGIHKFLPGYFSLQS